MDDASRLARTDARLHRALRLTTALLLAGVLVLGVGISVVIVIVVDGRGGVVAAGALLAVAGAGCALVGGLLLVRWLAVRRSLRASPWRAVRARFHRHPWAKQWDVRFEDGSVVVADDLTFRGDLRASGLVRTSGWSELAAPVDVLVAGGAAHRLALTTPSGDVLVPLRRPRTTRQAGRWQQRFAR